MELLHRIVLGVMIEICMFGSMIEFSVCMCLQMENYHLFVFVVCLFVVTVCIYVAVFTFASLLEPVCGRFLCVAHYLNLKNTNSSEHKSLLVS